MTCTNPACGTYPYYGVTPHTCFFRRGPEFKIGQSELLPQAEWPRNFRPDPEDNSGGTYYCPTCLKGMPILVHANVDPDASPEVKASVVAMVEHVAKRMEEP